MQRPPVGMLSSADLLRQASIEGFRHVDARRWCTANTFPQREGAQHSPREVAAHRLPVDAVDHWALPRPDHTQLRYQCQSDCGGSLFPSCHSSKGPAMLQGKTNVKHALKPPIVTGSVEVRHVQHCNYDITSVLRNCLIKSLIKGFWKPCSILFSHPAEKVLRWCISCSWHPTLASLTTVLW